jgi:hypothetical protein
MHSSNNEVEIIDPALATMVEVVDVESSAQKTPVAKEKSNNKNENTPVPKNKQATNNNESVDSKPKQPKPPKWQPKEDQSLCTSWLNMSKDAVIVEDL